MVAKFSVTRRLVAEAEATAGLLSRMLERASQLVDLGKKYGDDDQSVQRLKTAWNITQPITYPVLDDAIAIGRLGLRKLEGWIIEAKQGHGEDHLVLLVDALSLVNDSEHDFNQSTYAKWLENVQGQLAALVENVQTSIRRRETLALQGDRNGPTTLARA